MNDNNAPHYTELPIAQLEENKGQIDGLPANPRNIQPDKLAKLKRSILDNPEMLQLRGILVYPHGDKYIVIGGNMRLRAMVELGMTSAPCVVIPSHVTADKLTANRQAGQLCAFSYICKRLQSGYVGADCDRAFYFSRLYRSHRAMQEPNKPRVIISGGGTGGHINPALAIADEVRRRYPESQILFVGALGRMEMERVPAAGYEIVGLPVMGMDRKRLWRNFKVLRSLIKSRLMVRKTLADFHPDLVVGVGGYASAPTLKEAQRSGIPTLLQEQNSYAGVTNKLLARDAKCICVAYPGMERFFPSDRIILTGNPVRHAIEYNHTTREEACAYFALPSSLSRTILVMGGSLGARTINESVVAALPEWSKLGYQLIWQTGRSYEHEAQELIKEYDISKRAYVSTYVERMDLAYRLADVAVSRAGALSVSELCLSELPAILVPSPNVAEDHQTKNARALSTRGAAILLPDSEAIGQMGLTITELLKDEMRRDEMKAALRDLATPQAVERIVDQMELLW